VTPDLNAGASAVQKGDDFAQLVGYVEERTVLEERLQKMESFRGSIKDLIFRRVQRDYATRLATIREQFRPTMAEIVRRLKALEIEKDKLSERMEETNDLLTELRFRNEIGEFDEAVFREQEDGLLLRFEELGGSHDEAMRTISDYMFYLHDDGDFRQVASAEKVLERLEEDYKTERVRAAEAEQARWHSQRLTPAAPAQIQPPPRRAPGAAGPHALEAPALAAEIVEDEPPFLQQAFAQLLPAEEPTRTTAPAEPKAQRPPPPPGAQHAPPPPRRLPDPRTDPRLKGKVIRKAPNSGS
jgi:hypothetical protein